MSKATRIAIAGLGTVGAGLVRILTDSADLLAARCGGPLTLTAVSARNRSRDRGIDLTGVRWEDDLTALATAPDVDIVVELVGGEDGPAYALVKTALENGKSVVTANKALLAHHGVELAQLAEENGAVLNFEAAVAGGIPIIKALREALVANRVTRVYGILNGTCNYILTEMEATGRGFADVLAEAQDKGYAEADPSFDVGGIDAAHKLALLASLAFGTAVDFDSVYIEGIERITAADILFARELGYRIKLLGLAEATPQGIEQRVHPAMVPLTAPIAHVDGVLNAVMVDGDRVGSLAFEGPGAGAGATASAVAADIADIAKGHSHPPFILPAASLRRSGSAPIADHEGMGYIRLQVRDEPGVLAALTKILAAKGVSIESMIQRGRAPGAAVTVVLTTHECKEGVLRLALDEIGALPSVLEPPNFIRIETF